MTRVKHCADHSPGLRLRLIFCLCLGALGVGCRQPQLSQRTPQVPPPVSPVEHRVQRGASPSPVASRPPKMVKLTPLQSKLIQGARSTLGDVYDDGYYAGGPPPAGRGACTDVIYSAFLAAGVNLQDRLEEDVARNRTGYPSLGDRNINYRRAPNLIVWFERHSRSLPLDSDFAPADVVFWSLQNDGVADHVGLVSLGEDMVVHNIGPACCEEPALRAFKIVGHFRWSGR